MTDDSDLTARVQDSFDPERTDPRLRELLVPLVQHLHDYAREVRLTHAEWEQVVDFLTRTGQACDDLRQEFVLLSDVLGLSMLVEQLEADAAPGGSPQTVLGPFHLVESPPREQGDDINAGVPGERALVTGRVLSVTGEPVAGALVDAWQSDTDGNYDVQRESDEIGQGRGLFTTGDDGSFRFVTVVPSDYPIPTDGPVGELLAATGRHPNRPAHIHFQVVAPGFALLTTHLFVAGSVYLDSDAVFAATPDLVEEFVPDDDGEQAARNGLSTPFPHARIELVLTPEHARAS